MSSPDSHSHDELVADVFRALGESRFDMQVRDSLPVVVVAVEMTARVVKHVRSEAAGVPVVPETVKVEAAFPLQVLFLWDENDTAGWDGCRVAGLMDKQWSLLFYSLMSGPSRGKRSLLCLVDRANPGLGYQG